MKVSQDTFDEDFDRVFVRRSSLDTTTIVWRIYILCLATFVYLYRTLLKP